MSKLFSTVLVVAFISAVFAGCGGKVEESYQMVTLREAGHSNIVSPGFKFGFDTPKFVAVSGDVGLVREGNLIEFFTGNDLENKLKRVEGKRFVAGTTKLFSPRVHFSVDFLVAGTDTVRVGEAGSPRFPTLLRGFDEGQFEELEYSGLNSSTPSLKDIYDMKFKVNNCKITREEIRNAKGEPVRVYLIHLPRVKFILEPLDPGMELIVKAIMAENLYVNGAIGYGGMPSNTEFPRDYRERTNIGGTVKLEYVKYADQICPSMGQ
jgi:hypothetical protein